MSEPPNLQSDTDDFEFEALAQAVNYRKALFTEFGPFLKGDVVEVGAGIGQMTDHLVRLPAVRRAIAVEPDRRFCARHHADFPQHEILEGTAADLPADTACDAILSINVLEHIRDDEAELARYASLLRQRQGSLCLFVPARPEIYAPIDKDFGHFRRYKRPELRKKLVAAGFEIVRLHYFNSLGYFAWWLNFCLLKKRSFEGQKVRLYDRAIFPVVHALEVKALRPPFGQSLLAVGRSLPYGKPARRAGQ
ncbi:MAG TPA: class I SAM-dependent methyltransferase [Candidatus Acidoferrum sp.]|jgi:SAM-dependent methyltransferase|nr:class I SAM-dependent methyltransferase [Candidatus Acidoferrum sp.]